MRCIEVERRETHLTSFSSFTDTRNLSLSLRSLIVWCIASPVGSTSLIRSQISSNVSLWWCIFCLSLRFIANSQKSRFHRPSSCSFLSLTQRARARNPWTVQCFALPRLAAFFCLLYNFFFTLNKWRQQLFFQLLLLPLLWFCRKHAHKVGRESFVTSQSNANLGWIIGIKFSPKAMLMLWSDATYEALYRAISICPLNSHTAGTFDTQETLFVAFPLLITRVSPKISFFFFCFGDFFLRFSSFGLR